MFYLKGFELVLPGVLGEVMMITRATNGSKTVDRCLVVLQVISDHLRTENGTDIGLRLVDIAPRRALIKLQPIAIFIRWRALD